MALKNANVFLLFDAADVSTPAQIAVASSALQSVVTSRLSVAFAAKISTKQLGNSVTVKGVTKIVCQISIQGDGNAGEDLIVGTLVAQILTGADFDTILSNKLRVLSGTVTNPLRDTTVAQARAIEVTAPGIITETVPSTVPLIYVKLAEFADYTLYDVVTGQDIPVSSTGAVKLNITPVVNEISPTQLFYGANVYLYSPDRVLVANPFEINKFGKFTIETTNLLSIGAGAPDTFVMKSSYSPLELTLTKNATPIGSATSFGIIPPVMELRTETILVFGDLDGNYHEAGAGAWSNFGFTGFSDKNLTTFAAPAYDTMSISSVVSLLNNTAATIPVNTVVAKSTINKIAIV